MDIKNQRLDFHGFDVSSSADPQCAQLVAALSDYAAERKVFLFELADFQQIKEGEALLRKDAEWNRRGLAALTEQVLHWYAEGERIVAQAESDFQRLNSQLLPGGEEVHCRLVALCNAVANLTRRRLPLSESDLRNLVRASIRCMATTTLGVHASAPIRQAEYFVKSNSLPPPLCEAFLELRQVVERSYPDESKELCQRIDQIVSISDPQSKTMPVTATPTSTPKAAFVGNRGVLVNLKLKLGVIGAHELAAEEFSVVGPDGYHLRTDSPLADQHAALSRCFDKWVEAGENYRSILARDSDVDYKPLWKECEAVRHQAIESLLTDTANERGKMLLAICERNVERFLVRSGMADNSWESGEAIDEVSSKAAVDGTIGNRADDFDRLLFLSSIAGQYHPVTKWMVELAERYALEGGLSDGERHVLHRLRCAAISHPPMGVIPDVPSRLTRLLDGDVTLLLVPGEHWADAVHADLASMTSNQREAWSKLLRHALTAEAPKPAAQWNKDAKPLISAISPDKLRIRLRDWFALVSRGRSVLMLGAFPDDTRGAADTFSEGNATILKGLVWMLVLVPDAKTPRLVSDLLLTAIKKVPGVGPRCVKVANACVWALGEMATFSDDAIRDGALGQLARLKARVSFKTTLNAIEKALNKAAEHAGMSREDLEELGVPAFDFEAGVRREVLGDTTVELRVTGNGVLSQWTNATGKVVKAPPAAIKRDFKEDLKDLKQAAQDAEGILLAGRDRLDALYLADKAWRYGDWRERYLDHGLLGTIAGRLIWVVGDVPTLFYDGQPTDVTGRVVPLDEKVEVRLWHPVGRDLGEVVAWRERLEALHITQPFKQAHREVYLLTDAERNTNVYSNRYAAHILKQHQFNALCAARGWKNKLRLMVDDEYPPAFRALASWGIRAEYWIEGAGGEYGTDTNETGTYLYLTTDQVRFYRMDAQQVTAHAGGGGYHAGWRNDAPPQPLPLDQVPPLVFSEIMRDVDLFVGVASVGNDPAWGDSGVGEERQNYWRQYSFGDLSVTAQTRKAVLERLIPRLKIASRCELRDKFLVVRGELRTYKIHLGSGNILMEPNDQYLCIVPKASAATFTSGGGGEGGVFLPFEGDRTMAIVLSKAFLLADDRKITDPTIVSQIKRAVT